MVFIFKPTFYKTQELVSGYRKSGRFVKIYYKIYHSMVFMSLNQFPVRLWSQPRLKLVPKWNVISSNTGLCVGIYANLSFKQYQKELKKLTRLVIVVDINCDRTYGYSWKIHQWIYIQNFSIFYPLCSSLFRQYHSVLKHCPCLTIVMLTRNEFHSKSLFFFKNANCKFICNPKSIGRHRLDRCWWRILETKCVGDKFEMSLTDLMHWENHQHNEKSRQHNDSATNISNQSPS